MVDLAKGVEVRNYGLKRTPDPRTVRESLILFLPVAIIAGVLSFQIWIRSQTVYLGYQSQELSSQSDDLLRQRQLLVVEEQMLKNPKWLDEVAGKNLGMIALRPDQIIHAPAASWHDVNQKDAQMGNLARSIEPTKSALFERP